MEGGWKLLQEPALHALWLPQGLRHLLQARSAGAHMCMHMLSLTWPDHFTVGLVMQHIHFLSTDMCVWSPF